MNESEFRSSLRRYDRRRASGGGHGRPTGWISGFNVPGCLPDSASPPDPSAWPDAWDELLEIISEARRDAADDPVADAALLHAEAVVLTATPGEEFNAVTEIAGGVSLAWWIVPA